MNKLYENEQMFEKANTRVAKATSALAPENFPKDFVLELYCECANKACQERVSIAYDDYKAIKTTDTNGDPTFIVKPKHYLPEFERLVRQTLNYWIIIKRLEKLDKPFEV
jgi:hypothetical protein